MSCREEERWLLQTKEKEMIVEEKEILKKGSEKHRKMAGKDNITKTKVF